MCRLLAASERETLSLYPILLSLYPKRHDTFLQ
jgi:hypothetical protein